HTFDRLSAFEEWLEAESIDQHHPGASRLPSSTEEGSLGRPALSKNRREQLEKEVAAVEKKLAAVEAEIAELELSFQNPATGTDWETTHRRYADLKVMLDSLYQELARHWELMGH